MTVVSSTGYVTNSNVKASASNQIAHRSNEPMRLKREGAEAAWLWKRTAMSGSSDEVQLKKPLTWDLSNSG